MGPLFDGGQKKAKRNGDPGLSKLCVGELEPGKSPGHVLDAWPLSGAQWPAQRKASCFHILRSFFKKISYGFGKRRGRRFGADLDTRGVRGFRGSKSQQGVCHQSLVLFFFFFFSNGRTGLSLLSLDSTPPSPQRMCNSGTLWL